MGLNAKIILYLINPFVHVHPKSQSIRMLIVLIFRVYQIKEQYNDTTNKLSALKRFMVTS